MIILNQITVGSNACRPVIIHAVLMSIIFEHYKQLTKLMEQQKVNDKKRTSCILRFMDIGDNSASSYSR